MVAEVVKNFAAKCHLIFGCTSVSSTAVSLSVKLPEDPGLESRLEWPVC